MSELKMGLQFQEILLYLTEVLWDISDLTFVQNKEYEFSEMQIYTSFSRIEWLNNIRLIIVRKETTCSLSQTKSNLQQEQHN